MAKKQFKAESKRLLELMINSIYTNKEIFLRELVSNASDALDKRHYLSLTDQNYHVDDKDLKITITRDKENRQLIIEDTGIGMNKDELEKNLGTIARSGSAEFRDSLEKAEKNVDIIGQFGVGFYSAFMVAKRIVVESRGAREDQAYSWTSSGEDGYVISEIDKPETGTRITLDLKDDTEEEKYSEYLEEYNEFYKSNFNDWEDPQKVIHYNVEGNISYTALLFIPGRTPYNFYYQDFEPGLKLYSHNVFIMDKVKDLLPDHFRFVQGLVDSDDLSLNISREILQQDRQVKLIAKSIEKKIQKALEDMLKDDRKEYEKFFDNFGLNLKYGIYKDYGIHKEQLQDLILFHSSKDGSYVTLKEYTDRMKEGQKDIYYAAGKSIDEIERMPAMAKLKDKGYEVLYFLDERDEFVSSIMQKYGDHEFKSINKGDLDLDTEDEKKEKEKKQEENKDMLAAMKDALGDKVKEVRISSRLKDDPVCVVADEGVSLEMEKYMAQDPLNPNKVKAVKILEINPDHPVFAKLQKVYADDKDALKSYAEVLFDQALLIQGLPIDNPEEYARKIADLLVKA